MMKDFSNEVRLIKSSFLRKLLIVLGSMSFVLAIVGIFLPLLPTTPFLLLSAFCYAKSSARFYNWLMNNKFFGQYIQDWRDKKGLPLKTKIIALIFLFLTMVSTIVFFVPFLAVKFLLALIAILVATYILRLPTAR